MDRLVRYGEHFSSFCLQMKWYDWKSSGLSIASVIRYGRSFSGKVDSDFRSKSVELLARQKEIAKLISQTRNEIRQTSSS
jgi:hypothetical protein